MNSPRRKNYYIRNWLSALWPTRVEPQQWRALIWICVLAIFMLMVNFWAFINYYTVRIYTGRMAIYPLMVFVTAPEYFSANEDEEINFVFQNGPDHNTNVIFRLVNDNRGSRTNPLAMAENYKLLEGTINKRDLYYRQLKVRFPFSSEYNHLAPINLNLWGSTDKAEECEVLDLGMHLAPIPRARWLSNLLGTALLAIMVVLCHDSWKQLNNSDKKDED